VKATLGLRKEKIEWLQLSKMFQDATTITHTLGFRYIWIDSLCIIQDDIAGWERESAKMASIYENSALTISAIHASDGDGGCFTHTPRLAVGLGWIGARHIGPRPYGVSGWGEFSKCG